MSSARVHAGALVLALVAGCEAAPEPVLLFEGQWIDVLSFDRAADDTCAGSIAYLDAYAGVLAAEFGLDAPLGTYIWYTREQYDEQLPCGDDLPFPYSCALEDTVHSAFMPNEHELAHVANFHTGQCPNALGEGIAVYYSAENPDGRALDLDVLADHLAAPSEAMPIDDYEMLGRLAGALIEEYGLAAVLQVCASAGRHASGAQLADAMESILGVGPDAVLTALGQSPRWCDEFERYRSNVFACGVEPRAPSFGIADPDLEVSFDVGCEQQDTVSTAGGEEILRVFSVEVPVEDIYVITLIDEATQSAPVAGTVLISQCAPCGAGARLDENVGPYPYSLVTSLPAGRHAIEVRMPAAFSGALRLEMRP